MRAFLFPVASHVATPRLQSMDRPMTQDNRCLQELGEDRSTFTLQVVAVQVKFLELREHRQRLHQAAHVMGSPAGTSEPWSSARVRSALSGMCLEVLV